MRPLVAAGVLATQLFTSGCLVVSLQPVYDDSTVGYDEGLVGTWKTDEDDTTLTIEAAEWHGYRVVYTEGRDTFELAGHITRLGDRTLLDLMPQKGLDAAPLLVPVHAIYLIQREGDSVSLAGLDYDALKRRVGRGEPGAVLDERKNVVLTADTATLRRWLSRTGPGGAQFGEAAVLKRVHAG